MTLTLEQLSQERHSVEAELTALLKEVGSDFTFEDIKAIIYNEEDQDDLMKIVRIFDNGDPMQLDNILELASDAWNLFPHRLLNGKSPAEMAQSSANQKL